MKRTINLLSEFSVPLLCGVVSALIWANHDPAGYDHFLHRALIGPFDILFLTNDIFMVFFFGIAAVEITKSLSPGGSLHPLRNSVNPLCATAGGVLGPAAVYLSLNYFFGDPVLKSGWGIPTATDIAFAWLVARMVFGRRHPAVSFLVILAVADDGIGLAIIAFFYPDPNHSVSPVWLLLVVAGMTVSFILRSVRAKSYWPYLALGGVLSWTGIYKAHLHPALALVFVVPFLPHGPVGRALIFEEDMTDRSSMSRFEHEWKLIVDFGLFMFGLVNAGAELSAIGAATWFVVISLMLGKSSGIFFMGVIAERFGFRLPQKIRWKELFLIGAIAGFGFTVSLFIAGQAFADPVQQGAAKMGALLSSCAALFAIVMAKLFRIKRIV